MPVARVDVGLLHPRAQRRLRQIQVLRDLADAPVAHPAKAHRLRLELRFWKPEVTFFREGHGRGLEGKPPRRWPTEPTASASSPCPRATSPRARRLRPTCRRARNRRPEKPEPEDPEADDADLQGLEPVSDAELRAFINDPTLRKALDKVVRGRVNDADIDDVINGTLTDVWTQKKLPREPKARRRYVSAIARNKAIRWYTRNEKNRPDSEPLEAVPKGTTDDGGIERADSAQLVEKIAATVPEKERSAFLCWVRNVLWGESIADMAREMGVQESTLHKRIGAVRGRAKMSGLAIIGLAAVVFFFMNSLQPAGQVGAGYHEPEPGTAEAKTLAAELREDARTLCEAGRWKDCLGAYDDAKRAGSGGRDPAGEGGARQGARRGTQARAVSPGGRRTSRRGFAMPSDARLRPMPATKTAKRRTRSSRKYATPAQMRARTELIRLSGVKIDPSLLAKMRAEWEE